MTYGQFEHFSLEVTNRLMRIEESIDVAANQAHERWRADKRLELYREFCDCNLRAESTFKKMRIHGMGVLGLPEEDVDIVIAALRGLQGKEKDEYVDLAMVKENEE